MDTRKLVPFFIFQKVLATKYYNIESLGESHEVYFRIPNFYKNYEYLRVKISSYHNVLFEFLNQYYHRWRAKRVDIRDVFFEIKAKIAQYIKQHKVLNRELLDLLTSWLFLKFTLRFFYFSGRCWFKSSNCEDFGNPKETYTFWEVMTDPQESVSKYWYIKLFEKVYPRLISWIEYTSKPSKIRINLRNETTIDIFESILSSTINLGTPLLITKKDIVIMRKFEFPETKEIYSRRNTHIWLIKLLEILGKYGYSDFWYSYSTFKKYHRQPSKYPRYHGMVFKRG